MRDPDRIEPILELLRQEWMAKPDLRLCQLIYDVARRAAPDPLPPCPEFFYLDDEAMARALSLIEG